MNPNSERLGDSPLVLLSNRYRVLSLLSDGGFGKTFLVEDIHMPSLRRCVLKQLKPVQDRPELAQIVKDRFEREAATLEKLGEAHDQIPRLYAYFQEGGEFYLVEEWVEGVTLTQKVQSEGPQPEKTVQAVVANLLGAIAYVHSQKIVHRDIKPDNIILRAKDAMPVLIDFGAVKETMKTTITSGQQSSHSIVVGTPGYMPSEQIAGRPIYASDIYSLGMSAIYLLTGKIPQELTTDPQTGALSWRVYAPNISSGFANFLDCATHVSPQSRFATIQDMQSVLNTLMMSQMGSDRATHLAATPIVSAPQSRSAQPTQAAFPPAAFPPAASSPPTTGPRTMPVSPMGSLSSSDGSIYQPPVQPPIQQPPDPRAEASYQREPDPAGSQSSTYPSAHSSARSSTQSPEHSSARWKGAVVIGSMVGVGILVGALVLTQQIPIFPSRQAAESTDAVVDPESETPAPTTPPPPAPVSPTPVPPPASALNANGSVIGQGDSKNVRAGAGTNFPVVDTVETGNRIRVTSRRNDSDGFPWYQIVTPGGVQGWIAGQLIQIDGEAAPPVAVTPRPTPVPTPTPAPTQRPTPTPAPTLSPPTADRTNATIVSEESGSKNIRSGPGTNYPVEHVAYPGDRIIIQSSSADTGGYTWYKVTFPESGAEGWIASQLVKRD